MYRALLLIAMVAAVAAQPVRLTVTTPVVTRIIDEKLYGQPVGAGIWGEAVRNGRFSETLAEGEWRVHDGVLECAASGGRLRLDAPREYDLTFEMRTMTIPGSIRIGDLVFNPEQTGWLRTRVRVAGKRADVWLEDTPLTPMAASQVELSAKGAAQFRSFKFNSLEGHLLYSGLPLSVRNWYAAGPVDVYREGSSLHVSTGDTNGIAAIEQHGIAVRAGDTLRGELRGRGSLNGLTVRLLDGAKVIGAGAGQSLSLTPIASVPDATLQILLPRRADAAIERLTLTYDSVRASGGYHADLVNALAALHPPVLRWSAENWKSAEFGVDQFLALAQKLRSQPVIAIPRSMSDAEREELVGRCESRVKYFDRGGYAAEWQAESALEAAAALIDLERDPKTPMAVPAPATVIDFDQHPWIPTPLYTVVQLFREHFASDLLQMTGDSGVLNAIATRTGDGRRIYLKLVNQKSAAEDVELSLRGDFPVLAAELQLAGADALRVTRGSVERSGMTVRFRVPALTAAVVTLMR